MCDQSLTAFPKGSTSPKVGAVYSFRPEAFVIYRLSPKLHGDFRLVECFPRSPASLYESIFLGTTRRMRTNLFEPNVPKAGK